MFQAILIRQFICALTAVAMLFAAVPAAFACACQDGNALGVTAIHVSDANARTCCAKPASQSARSCCAVPADDAKSCCCCAAPEAHSSDKQSSSDDRSSKGLACGCQPSSDPISVPVSGLIDLSDLIPTLYTTIPTWLSFYGAEPGRLRTIGHVSPPIDRVIVLSRLTC